MFYHVYRNKKLVALFFYFEDCIDFMKGINQKKDWLEDSWTVKLEEK